MSLHKAVLRIASDLPQGDSTRRALLKALTAENWIPKDLEKGRCTPAPNPDCPVGSPQYNLAQTFKNHPEWGEKGGKKAARGDYVLRVEKGRYRGSYPFKTPQEAVSASGNHASFSNRDKSKGLALLRDGKPWSVDSSAGSFTIRPPKGGKKAAGHVTYKEYVRDWKKLRYPVSVKGQLVPEKRWQKLMDKEGKK